VPRRYWYDALEVRNSTLSSPVSCRLLREGERLALNREKRRYQAPGVPRSTTTLPGTECGGSHDWRVLRMSFISSTRCRSSVGLGSNSGTK
jgi:hypothetical protein